VHLQPELLRLPLLETGPLDPGVTPPGRDQGNTVSRRNIGRARLLQAACPKIAGGVAPLHPELQPSRQIPVRPRDLPRRDRCTRIPSFGLEVDLEPVRGFGGLGRPQEPQLDLALKAPLQLEGNVNPLGSSRRFKPQVVQARLARAAAGFARSTSCKVQREGGIGMRDSGPQCRLSALAVAPGVKMSQEREVPRTRAIRSPRLSISIRILTHRSAFIRRNERKIYAPMRDP